MFEAVVTQADILRSLDAEPVVLGLRDSASQDDVWRLKGCEVRLADVRGPATFGYAPQLPELVRTARLDLLHLNGIWQYPSRVAHKLADHSGLPLVISPHGMLDPWITRRNAWKKHLGRWLWERAAWQTANAFHALTRAEAADIANEAPGAKIGVVPNAAPPITSAMGRERPPMVLYLGRNHDKKNLSALMEAWLSVRSDLPSGASLTIAGWGDDEGIAAIESAMKGNRDTGIEFVGTAFGSQKAALLDIARFLILPSHSEGLPMAILEAWAARVPTIMSEHCHLPEGFTEGAAIDCGTSAGSIGAALRQAFALDHQEWQRMSDAAGALAGGPFSQQSVAERWEGFYSALL